ncbi:MAG TPA: sugar transferase [Sulfobacillus sp.]|nr:sugar transferase [Sulfobacillus sp.]
MLILKRLFDVTASLLLMALFSWLFILIALMIRLDSKGPVFFVQIRVGRHGKSFPMLKFRTMYDGTERKWQAPSKEGALSYKFQDQGDDRITPLGRILRRSSLDELPQLWNVLRGQMSLVGPRPEIPEMVALYPDYAHARHRMRPGITGLAQVMGRGDLTLAETLHWDMEYCKNWTIGLDFKIIWKTLSAVLRRRGAY